MTICLLPQKSKSGQFNDYRYAGLDWWKNNQSKSSSYLFWSSAGLTGNQANAFKKAKKNFKNPYDQTTMESSVPEGPRYEGDRRMVLNLRYRPAPR